MIRIMGFVLLFSKKCIYLERNTPQTECGPSQKVSAAMGFFTFIINKKFPPGSRKSAQHFYCYFLFIDMGDLLSYFLLMPSRCF